MIQNAKAGPRSAVNKGDVSRKEGNVCDGIPESAVVSDKSRDRMSEAISLMTYEGIDSGRKDKRKKRGGNNSPVLTVGAETLQRSGQGSIRWIYYNSDMMTVENEGSGLNGGTVLCGSG